MSQGVPRFQQRSCVHSSAPANATPSESSYDTANPGYIRKYLRSYGLTPPRVESYETQKTRCLRQLALKPTSIDKFLYLSTLRRNNVHLFYRLVVDHLKELTPLIYTPVVGEACQRWSEIYQQPEGMYISYEDRGNIAAVIQNWPQPHVDITVITDGSRILGLGDLGINGMGIPIGKLALYTACAGVRPDATLPLTLDLGTSNKALREDPLYMGSRRDKVTPEQELEFMDELMIALTEKWPGIVVQFEDFKNPFPALERYRHRFTCFNDDIQGTGAVILAGVMNAVKQSGIPTREHKAVFLGAGSAGVGVAKQIVDFFVREGMTEDDAKACFYLVDTKGLVTADRGDKLAPHKVYFARTDNQGQQLKTLSEVVNHVKPTMLMGLSTLGGVFTPEILRSMASFSKRPIIFPLSNPSANSECDFEAAITHTDGQALFASGSPFQPFSFKNSAGQTKTYYPGQGNNMYVFPGIGLGTILSKAVEVTDSMIYASAEALSKTLTPEELEHGLLYPDLTRIREVSVVVARGVIHAAQEAKVDRETGIRALSDADMDAWIRSKMYAPHSEVASLEREVGILLSSIGRPSYGSNGWEMGSDEDPNDKGAKL
ncbi:malate dehydrogenase (oxaloacetate-decarboxylating)(NADP+) [Blastomyces dermatitidis ER-3]|nr:malate dehydrogenase (oxaloacetate-decarboxylating)(NADP+) [Blastomyces dermatitidis ER-3]EEQ83389.1 malate dehydrogenase (oxaloacetate-decarboxylating)(NADP+) [Blastomyces dermatitidis ER-3]EQL35926.1 malate dehydrogenase (oxaloacetate-decarboxylating)(NADP+) [Blastomyces dermatitidis ATCC 26199]